MNHHGGAASPAAANAALQGASFAFHKRKTSTDPTAQSRSPPGHGALSTVPLSAHNTGSSAGLPDLDAASSRDIVATRIQQLGRQQQHEQHQRQQSQKLLQPGNVDQRNNASFIAATLAASRSVSPSSRERPARQQQQQQRFSVDGASVADDVDSAPIAPAGSLISMFEGEKTAAPRRKRASPDRRVRADDRTSQARTRPRSPASSTRSSVESRSRQGNTSSDGQESRVASTTAKPSKPPKPTVDSGPSAAAQMTTPTRSRTEPIPPPVTDARAQQSIRPKPETPTREPQSHVEKNTLRRDEGHAAGTGNHAPGFVNHQTSPAVEQAQAVPRLGPRSSKPQLQPMEGDPQKPVKPERRPVVEQSTPPQPPKARQPAAEVPASKPTVARKHQPSTNTRPTAEALSPKPTAAQEQQPAQSTAPQHRKTISRPQQQEATREASHDHRSNGSATKAQDEERRPPMPPKPRGNKSGNLTRTLTGSSRNTLHRTTTTDTDDTTNDVFVSAPTSPRPSAPPLPSRAPTMAASSPQPQPSGPPLPSRASTMAAGSPPSPTRRAQRGGPYHGQSGSVSNLNLNSLTNAIMAGSLAARLTPSNTGSSIQPPPSPPQRTRTPRLRQTMRGPSHESDDEESRHRKAHHHHRHKLRSNKHAHHEGSRKKWRDEIRPLERKRYEALWASNRGTLRDLLRGQTGAGSEQRRDGNRGGGTAMDDFIPNVAVREIWRRSRLPEDELAEIWELVDRDGHGFLARQEFVVGMWLIDQRLKGRKIPAKVSDSVWGSANGVSVKGPPRLK